jgi:predicted transcriptional regulator of viral defense system
MEASTRIVVALGRLKGLFFEFPEALVSLDEASCIVGLEPHHCHALLSALEDVRFLERTADGKYSLRYVEAASIAVPMSMRAPAGQPTAAA